MKTNVKQYAIALLRGVTVFLLTLGVGALTSLRVRAIYLAEEFNSFAGFPREGVAAIALLADLLILNSFCRLFLLYHRSFRDAYLEEHREDTVTLSESFRSPIYWIELTGLLLPIALIAPLRPFGELETLLGIVARDGALPVLLPVLILLPLYFGIYTWQHYECRRHFIILRRTDELSRLRRPLPIVATALVILFGYPLIFPYAPYLIFAIATVVNTFVSLGETMTVPLLLLLLLALLVLPPLVRRLRTLRRRVKFLKRLAALAEERGYTFTLHHTPRATFKSSEPTHLALTRDGRVYHGSFLYCPARLPVYFTQKNEGYFLRRIGTRHHHLEFKLPFRYATEEGGEPLLLLDPPPRRMYATDGKSCRTLDFCDRVFSAVLYSPEVFVGVLDRDCLGRYNSFSD